MCGSLLERCGLQPGDRLVFVPDGVMNFLPLHAIRLSDNQWLGDRYEVSYTPSLSVLLQCLRRKPPEPTNMLAVFDPTGDLPGTRLEAAIAHQHFPGPDCQPLNRIDRQEFLRRAAESHVCYWMGHAQFLLPVPYWSGLVYQETGRKEVTVVRDGLSQQQVCSAVKPPDDLITYIDIDCGPRLSECCLAILSGCQSGLALSGKGNETVSLVAAFLNAGAKCVLASLWPVDDRACVLTMWRFLAAWRDEGQGIAAALKTAQQWLRDLTAAELMDWCKPLEQTELRRLVTHVKACANVWRENHGPDYRPFASPFHWAPFVAVGQTWRDAISP